MIVPGERAFVGGYNTPGLEVWTYPLQLLHGYWISFRIEGDSAEIDGRSSLRTIEQTPAATTRIYAGSGFTIREHIVTAVDLPGAAISYAVESSRPVLITVHFTPSLNLMWPGGVGGQEIHWDATHTAYTIDEPSHRFRGVVVSRQIVAHEQVLNNRIGAEFERSIAFTMRATAGGQGGATIAVAGSSTPDVDPIAVAETLVMHVDDQERRARERYDRVHVIDIQTPDSAANRAIRWAQVTLEQAWACNPQLGCGLLAGYGPSRGARRPQYAWFFGGDGLVAVDALLREGAYTRAREELAFILRYQNERTGAIWHELSQSAGFLDWAGAYPYMFAHVDISFDFLDTVRDYVETTGDVGFAKTHWNAIRAAYGYCRSTITPGDALPSIPAGKEGRDEQDPQRDELSLSLAWVSAARSFATLARLTDHQTLAADASSASSRARAAIRPTYFDAQRRAWASGHLRSGAPVEGLTGSLIALLHQGLLSEAEQSALLQQLASPTYGAPWGIRSTPNDSPLYDPDSYARGSVWAIGTADALMAFLEGGRASMALQLWRDLVPWFGLDSPGHMHEVLNGNTFMPERESVPDQSWSSAAFVSSAVRGILGLRADGINRRLTFAPQLAPEWSTLRVARIKLGDDDVSLALTMSLDSVALEIENAGPAMTLTFRPPGVVATNVRAAGVSDDSRIRTATREGAYEIQVVCPAHRSSRMVLRLSR